MMRTLRVTGKGQIKVRPDTTRITMALSGLSQEYAEALRASSEDTNRLSALLTRFGFVRADLKTLSFDIDVNYESYKVKDTYKRRFVGYRYSHVLKVEFLSDNDRLGEILHALTTCSVHPEIRLSYTLSDPEAAKNALLGQAVADARGKAAVLTNAAGVRLGDIQSIDYSWSESEITVQSIRALPMVAEGMAPERLSMDVEPDDVELSDTVTVIWEIGA